MFWFQNYPNTCACVFAWDPHWAADLTLSLCSLTSTDLEHWLSFFFFFNFLNFYFLQLYCFNAIFPMGNPGCFHWLKPAATGSCYPTYCACWVFYCFHNPPNFDMDYRLFHVRTDVNACDCTRGCTDTRKRVCTESWLWEKNPSPHRGIEPASAAWRSGALTNWAISPSPFSWCVCSPGVIPSGWLGSKHLLNKFFMSQQQDDGARCKT